MKKKWTLDMVLDNLQGIADPAVVEKKAKKFGVKTEGAIGVLMKDINLLAKEIGKNDDLGIALFDCGIYEAKLLCSKIFRSKSLTSALMESWVKAFDNWEICDSFSMKLFTAGPFAMEKILDWTQREAEFEKRAGFVMLTCYGSVYKKVPNSEIEAFFPIIRRAAGDNRIYVKKALSWALRNIGKRNKDLKALAIAEAQTLLNREEAAAIWIAKDVLRELESPDLKMRNYPRSVYG